MLAQFCHLRLTSCPAGFRLLLHFQSWEKYQCAKPGLWIHKQLLKDLSGRKLRLDNSLWNGFWQREDGRELQITVCFSLLMNCYKTRIFCTVCPKMSYLVDALSSWWAMSLCNSSGSKGQCDNSSCIGSQSLCFASILPHSCCWICTFQIKQ